MGPLRADLAARINALRLTAVTAADLVVGAIALTALLAAIKGLSWPWTAATVSTTAAALAASVHFRSRRDAGRREWADASGSRSGDKAGTSEAALNAALHGLPDAAMILDGKLAVIDANAPARQAFSILPGRHIAQVTRAPELLQAVDAAIEQAATQAFLLQLPPPLDRSFGVRVTPLGNREAGRPAVLILLRDMTEHEQLSRMRADFVANASHELRTPLASLKGFIETLQGAAKDDARARDTFLGIMHEQASRMSRLIDDLLSLSGIEMREHVLPGGTVDLHVIVTEVTNLLKPIAGKAGININVGNLIHPAYVSGDKDELTQIVQNLMQNAIKYGRKGGNVEVGMAREGLLMALSVQDDGIGIAPEHLPRLTERFYRVNAIDSRERGGTGLGLAIVKHIVARHRGQLRIASVKGHGSTFTVLLPTADGSKNTDQ